MLPKHSLLGHGGSNDFEKNLHILLDISIIFCFQCLIARLLSMLVRKNCD